MARFRVEIPSDELCFTKAGDGEREQLRADLRDFPKRYLARHEKTPELDSLFEALRQGHFHHVLTKLDGSHNWFEPDSAETREEIRNWAKANFTPQELQELFRLCTRSAFFSPCDWYLPNPDVFLYRDLYENPDSLFRSAQTASLRRRLNNARFWEALPEMLHGINHGLAFTIVNDVLANFYEDLDPDWIDFGYRLFLRNNGEKSHFTLSGLGDKAVDRYIEFVGRVDQARQLFDPPERIEQIAYLVRPYAQIVVHLFEDGWGRTSSRFAAPRDFKARLREWPLVDYLQVSPLVQTEVADQLATVGINRGYPQHLVEVLECLDQPQMILAETFSRLSPQEYALKDLVKSCRLFKVDLSPYLNGETRPLLEAAAKEVESEEEKFRKKLRKKIQIE